jgi:carbohydrate diacid regulator
MATIGAALANEIVERTMKIIPFNVNVMDARGIIIASGEFERIGDLHSGAQLALTRGSSVEISETATDIFSGAKAGINLLLSVRGKICGVVGISGPPDAVRQFGELVRVNAEMILEQAALIGELQRERGYREEFLFQLVKKTGISNSSMEAWAARLGIDLGLERAVFVLELSDENQRPDLTLMELQRAQAELAGRWPDLLTVVITPRELAMLDTFHETGPQATRVAKAKKRLASLEGVIKHVITVPSVLSMGIALPGVDGAAASYESARKTARVGRARQQLATTFSYYDLSLPVLLSGLYSGWQAEQLGLPLMRLRDFDRKAGTLLKTLAAWFENHNHPISTAKAMRIHRNTLDYRLQKISELTGLDLSNTEDRLFLYLALQLHELGAE